MMTTDEISEAIGNWDMDITDPQYHFLVIQAYLSSTHEVARYNSDVLDRMEMLMSRIADALDSAHE